MSGIGARLCLALAIFACFAGAASAAPVLYRCVGSAPHEHQLRIAVDEQAQLVASTYDNFWSQPRNERTWQFASFNAGAVMARSEGGAGTWQEFRLDQATGAFTYDTSNGLYSQGACGREDAPESRPRTPPRSPNWR